MRIQVLIPLLCLALLGGCGPGDCLPVPEADETPPDVRLMVTFTDWATGRRDSVVLVTPCETAPTIEADVAGEVVVVYAGTDDEGMKHLQLGLSIYQTAGLGIRMESFNVPPITTRCPRKQLAGKRSFVGGQGKRNVTLSVSAENWAGQRTATPPLVVRQRPSKRL